MDTLRIIEQIDPPVMSGVVNHDSDHSVLIFEWNGEKRVSKYGRVLFPNTEEKRENILKSFSENNLVKVAEGMLPIKAFFESI